MTANASSSATSSCFIRFIILLKFFFDRTAFEHLLPVVRVFYFFLFAQPDGALFIVIHGAIVLIEQLTAAKRDYQIVHVFTQHIKMFTLMRDITRIRADMLSMFSRIIFHVFIYFSLRESQIGLINLLERTF